MHLPYYNTNQLIQVAKERLAEFMVVQPPRSIFAPKPIVHWHPRATYLFKINFDGAIFKTENKSGIRITI